MGSLSRQLGHLAQPSTICRLRSDIVAILLLKKQSSEACKCDHSWIIHGSFVHWGQAKVHSLDGHHSFLTHSRQLETNPSSSFLNSSVSSAAAAVAAHLHHTHSQLIQRDVNATHTVMLV
jgi:hypothetical protein